MNSGSRATYGDGSYLVSPTGPDAIPFANGKLKMIVDGVTVERPLSDLAPQLPVGATSWKPGEVVCLSGSAAACLLPGADSVTLAVVSRDHLVFSVPALADLAPSIPPAPAPAPAPAPPPPPPPATFTITNGTVKPAQNGTVVVKVLGSQITYGAGGPIVPVTLKYSANGGSSYANLFNGSAVAANMTYTTNVTNGSSLGLSGRATYLNLFDATYTSYQNNGHVLVLKDNDPVPAATAFDNQASLASFLQSYVDVPGQQMVLQPNQVIVLWEFNSNLNSPAVDNQDLVVLLSFS